MIFCQVISYKVIYKTCFSVNTISKSESSFPGRMFFEEVKINTEKACKYDKLHGCAMMINAHTSLK